MKIAILGAGAGGCAAAAELNAAGHEVRLWARSADTIAPFVDRRIVSYTGVLGDGECAISWAGNDLGEALKGVDGAVAVLPTMLHAELGRELARVGWQGPVLLNPGHTGGGLALRQGYVAADRSPPAIAELSTLTYVARKSGPVTVSITGKAKQVRIASLCDPTSQALTFGTTLFPSADRVENVIATGLMNANLVLHAPGAILGASWVEATGGRFTFYVEGLGDSVASVMSALDGERMAVANSFGLSVPDLFSEMHAIGTIEEGTDPGIGLAAAIRGGKANARILAPDGFGHRYYVEDILYGLMPFTALAKVSGVETNVASALLTIGRTFLTGCPFAGRDAAEMGISGLDRSGLLALVEG